MAFADKGKSLSVYDIGKGDILFPAEKPFLGKKDIQGIVSGLSKRIIDHDREFDFISSPNRSQIGFRPNLKTVNVSPTTNCIVSIGGRVIAIR